MHAYSKLTINVFTNFLVGLLKVLQESSPSLSSSDQNPQRNLGIGTNWVKSIKLKIQNPKIATFFHENNLSLSVLGMRSLTRSLHSLLSEVAGRICYHRADLVMSTDKVYI